MIEMLLSETVWKATLSHVQPVSRKSFHFGDQVTLVARDSCEYEQWVDCMLDAAIEYAEGGDMKLMEKIYAEMERSDKLAGVTTLPVGD